MLAELVLDAELDVAAELDVGAAAGHVGGDGHRAEAAGLGDDMRLLLVEAGVEHLVLDAFPSRYSDSSSDFSIETVPTSTGWPIACFSLIDLAIASNLSSWFL